MQSLVWINVLHENLTASEGKVSHLLICFFKTMYYHQSRPFIADYTVSVFLIAKIVYHP